METTKQQTDIKGKEKNIKIIRYIKVFRYATFSEWSQIGLAFILTIIKGCSMPFMIIIYSEFMGLLVERNYGEGTSTETGLLKYFGGGKILVNATREENFLEIHNDAIAYGILMCIGSLVSFIAGIFSVDIINFVALKQITRIRNNFFKSVIRQDISWHDTIKDENFSVKITEDIEKIRDGISEKLIHFSNLISTSGILICLSFYYCWELTLVVCPYIPLAFIASLITTKSQAKLSIQEMKAYSKAGNVVEEVLGAILTVKAFNGVQKECERYAHELNPAKLAGQRKGIFTGCGEAIIKSLLFFSYAVAFWYSFELILNERQAVIKHYSPAAVMIVMWCMFVGADNISRTSLFMEAFALARVSATSIFKIIDRQPNIDPLSLDGKILNYGLKGNIEFKDVFFRYPSRNEITILRGINISIDYGQTIAFVGFSGCGKSTCIQLIQRLYDPVFGEILLDGVDIRNYNIKWLRSNIAVVGQEPVLFAGSIGDNIKYGKINATQKEIEDAAKSAGAHDFIINLPESYNTSLGENGARLSGGQKQRIAIARALILKRRHG